MTNAMFKDTKAFSGFSVDDVEKAKEFYGQTLGLDVHEEQEPMAMLTLNLATGGTVLIYPKNDHTPASFTILNFPVEDIDQAVAELTARGVEFVQLDNPDMPQDDKGIMRGLVQNMGPDIAWFTDPAGNSLSVLQDK